jgi:ribosomal protein S12 methylthiotransferase
METPAPRKARIITLGCAKNEVDSEEIAGVLRQEGWQVGETAEEGVTIINTCGFLESAKEESILAIRKAVAEKGEGRVIVAGCLAQRLGAELARLAPGADAYVGVGQMARFHDIAAGVFGRTQPLLDVEPPHHRWARTGRPWSAYLKISEGCDHRCTFCTIPSFRGAHQSKPIERIVEEAKMLAATGAKEINLIAQDVTQYGFDLYQKFTLPSLLKELNEVDGIEWIRLLYFYPSRLTDEVLGAMAGLPKVLPYVDMPLQHVHPDVLRRMKRPWDGERYLALIQKVRTAIPGAAIRSTFIVGFPGETEEEFRALLDWVRDAKLDRVGSFMFSREPGTPSHDMPSQVSFLKKKERMDRLMSAQLAISRGINRGWVGKTLRVLIDEHKDGWSAGRSFRDAPEIDGLVFARGVAEPGSLVDVEVTEAGDHDLTGVLVGSSVCPTRRLAPLRMAGPRRPL